MGTQTGCGGKVLPWPDPGEEEVSGEGICSVGAEEVTWARKGWVWEKLQKSLARGRIGDSPQSPGFSPSGLLPSGEQARGRPHQGDTLSLGAAGREGAGKQAGQSQAELWGIVCPPPCKREGRARGWGGHQAHICSQWGRVLSLSLPHPCRPHPHQSSWVSGKHGLDGTPQNRVAAAEGTHSPTPLPAAKLT